jgi:hypothetical protein
LTPADATKPVDIPGNPTTNAAVLFGATSIASRGRLTHHQSAAASYFSENIGMSSPGFWAQDDATKASWMLALNNAADNVLIQRSPAGSATLATLVTVNNNGRVTLGADPTAALDAATKQYVDSKPSGVAAIGTTAPTSPAVGQLWWRSDTGRLMIWYDDGTSQQWVPANPV